MHRVVVAVSAGLLLLLTGSVQAQLIDNWRESFQSGEGWQLACTDGRRGRACPPTLYYFNPPQDDVAPDDIIVGMVFSMSRGKVYIQPWEGTCTGGEIKVDGQILADLAQSTHGCIPRGGRPFMYLHEKHSFYNVSTLSEGRTLAVTLTLDSGATVQQSLPLAGFKERFEEYRATEGSGRRGGRRR